jgi:hypothetical protein
VTSTARLRRRRPASAGARIETDDGILGALMPDFAPVRGRGLKHQDGSVNDDAVGQFGGRDRSG